MRRRSARVLVLALAACGSVNACTHNPAGPQAGPLAVGRWTGSAACLSVTETICNVVVGCGHGQFPPPVVGTDGIFEVDGTYRVEAGPVSINPAPPAHFSGSVSGSRLILIVIPTGSLPPASYSMTPASAGTCTVPCV